ncbi:PREDICTED: tyrosine-protein kinase shark-like isoform X2 [Branchiostoma belcheri]|uniref:receptor protein-tyrosine kinase n=1 Tax=Branchiostoma belcheri TaxID=7741 RepID=A0A6P5A386_BRABE|nr:PREDICTED: tyrosine-protein kinase shark-like isoform X2 [Branchiostoma belcheri]
MFGRVRKLLVVVLTIAVVVDGTFDTATFTSSAATTLTLTTDIAPSPSFTTLAVLTETLTLTTDIFQTPPFTLTSAMLSETQILTTDIGEISPTTSFTTSTMLTETLTLTTDIGEISPTPSFTNLAMLSETKILATDIDGISPTPSFGTSAMLSETPTLTTDMYGIFPTLSFTNLAMLPETQTLATDISEISPTPSFTPSVMSLETQTLATDIDGIFPTPSFTTLAMLPETPIPTADIIGNSSTPTVTDEAPTSGTTSLTTESNGESTTVNDGTDGLTNAQSVGIGVGTALGIIVLLIIILTAIFWRKRQKKTERRENHADEMMDIHVPPEGTTSRESIVSSQLIDTAFANDLNVVSNAGGVVNEGFGMSYAVPEEHGRLSQVQTVDDVSKFLQVHNFAEYIEAFQDQEVDGDALRCLDAAVMRELIPKAGPRAKFKDILRQQRRVQATSEPGVARLIFREILRKNLKLGKLLGRGQFGEVRLGEVRKRGVSTTVAVKTLHASASDKDKKDLMGELEILVTVGRHDNVISLVGACTIDGPLCVVVEYAPNGSLKDWLKANSPERIRQESAAGYYNIEDPQLPSPPMEQLIQFGIDVAAGMSHLAAMQCVHRDLAARNILLGEGLVAKVSDFGLSRDIYEDAEYVKTTLSKLPLRWMAYESLFYNVYTIQSDVWSYGVLLWEILTMGKLPYQGIKGKKMMNMIKAGYRLEKPVLCPDDIYDVMTSCWESLPEDRPTFPQLRNSLDRIVQQYKQYASLLK